MKDFATLRYGSTDEGVLRITLARPEKRNAQSSLMLRELNEAFDNALLDDGVKVIILAGEDPDFSAGHDMKELDHVRPGGDFRPISTWGDWGQAGMQDRFTREQEIYLQSTRRWRNLSKPTIAQVQGKCAAGGLMLAWCCDLIIASDDAVFWDPTVAMGVCGVEWFVHPFELGARKAKELLWTGDQWSAQEARDLGMVNHVVPRSALAEQTLLLAKRIATKPSFGVRMAKDAVNKTLDLMGQSSAIDYAFGLHQMLHAHNLLVHGRTADPMGLPPSVFKTKGDAK